ncbi:MAG: PorP/SprF family type IX secretion system membrane protein [Flavobacteriales bacterium]
MKKLLFAIAIIWASNTIAQQSWQLTQYTSNMYLVNPATAGERKMLDMNFSYRQQWLGSQYAPKTYYISGTSRILEPKTLRSTTVPTSADYGEKVEKGKLVHSVGGLLLRDDFGAFSYTSIGASYNIHVPINRSWKLSAALKGTMKNWVFDPTKTQTGTANDPTLAQFTANSQAFNDWIPSLDLGLYAYSRYLFVSYATDQLTQGQLKFEGTTVNPALQMTHYAMVGGRIALSQSTHLVPSTLIKYTASSPISMDFNLKLDVQDRYFASAGYRYNSDIILVGGLFLNDMMKIGYSFDYPINSTKTLGFGSHEFFLGLELFKH